jgi:hypothetical protein
MTFYDSIILYWCLPTKINTENFKVCGNSTGLILQVVRILDTGAAEAHQTGLGCQQSILVVVYSSQTVVTVPSMLSGRLTQGCLIRRYGAQNGARLII